MGFLSWPYPEESVGYWGNVTSTIDWCEENYVVSYYVAEWSNTISNIVYLMTTFYSTYCTYRNSLEFRFYLIGAGYGIVGVGSWLFHMTLQYRFQLLDELPMNYAMSIPVWSLVSEAIDEIRSIKDRKEKKEQSHKDEILTGSLIFLTISIVTWIYLKSKDTDVHEVLFGVLVVLVAISSGLLTHNHTIDYDMKKNLYSAMALGVVFFLSGFTAWKLDIHYCNFWIYLRRNVLALPLGMFLELHGWWHALTGVGIYYYLVYLQYLRVITTGTYGKYKFIWRWKIFPELVPKDMEISTQYSNTLFGSLVTTKDSKEEENRKKK
ncbi:ceramidase NDAI_0C05640 [Naumovozyma dairenensis CBS 421]|uniref:Alkaline ceramidase n=1 Tax=Naumovozyma dairenensis (strain ATCC 10597 / BCRC 20456 / CBS 421 / NBRC 0211 / NRRL Y-12639) TaxID=1071378 RepID=G0W8W2_NAUDC|nr:hypothetical protein NDAI_0C05640 [Naumovozyma dairenensis CBS 421]CCD24223.1 hypothetical protein NDAI_0C05640 [Naumovozyma dairenensis CBS 421]